MKTFNQYINESKKIRFVDYSKLPFFKNSNELSNKIFYYCDFTMQEFSEMQINNSEFIECIFDSSFIGYSEFKNCIFNKCSFKNTIFNEVHMDDCKFIETEINDKHPNRIYIN
jgi:uncharacterized protein YjbI with pentapeptide repeats